MSFFGSGNAVELVSEALTSRAEMAEELVHALRAEIITERARYQQLVERMAAMLPTTLPPNVADASVAPPNGETVPHEVAAAIRRVALNDARLSAHLWAWAQEPEQKARWHDPIGLPKLLDQIIRGKGARG